MSSTVTDKAVDEVTRPPTMAVLGPRRAMVPKPSRLGFFLLTKSQLRVVFAACAVRGR